MSALKKIVVKVGTHTITSGEGLLDSKALKSLVGQIVALRQKDIDVILVSSGAVGAGRSLVRLNQNNNKVMQRQAYSSVGQIKLMSNYSNLFQKHDIHCAQVLATKEDFRDRTHFLNMRNCLQTLSSNRIVPIVNENDVVAINELMFTDNDELAGLIAAMVDADALFILSHIDGLYDGDPKEAASQLIDVVHPDTKLNITYSANTKSMFGRGGMHTKLRIARKAAEMGIKCWILNGKRKNSLLETIEGVPHGTMFTTSKEISNVKKWLSYADAKDKGCVVINEGAEQALTASDKVSSLLPIGVVKIEGGFEKGDVIKIINVNNKNIGLGIAQYSSRLAKTRLGKKGCKPLVHYDYLFIGG